MIRHRYLHPLLCWALGHPPAVWRRLDRDEYECPCGTLRVTRFTLIRWPERFPPRRWCRLAGRFGE